MDCSSVDCFPHLVYNHSTRVSGSNIPTAPLKFLMAAPAAVSNWIILIPPFRP